MVRVRVRDELSTIGRHRLTIHMVRPGRVRVSLSNSRQRLEGPVGTHYSYGEAR